ncbi:MAG: hypothetical protein J6L61_05865 [Ruminiclostridium sp.]|nr:hypothetical protein [Ruminiclostridium sp.]
MKHFKKLIAAICAVAFTLSVAGCADVSTIGSIDDQTINAGIYLLYEQTAISEAQQEVDDQLKAMGTDSSKIDDFNYYNYNVQDKTFSQYVQDRTLEQVKQYVAIQNKFKELNLSLTDEEEDTVKASVKKMWDTEISYYGYSTGKTYGQNYEAGGISKKSYEAVQLVNKMSEKVFDAYYEKNGISATDEKDIATYFYDNYGRFQIIQVSLSEGNGDKITTDEGKKAKKEQAQGYVDRILAGEDYDTVYHEYEDLVAKEKAEAEAESNSGASSNVSSEASSTVSSTSETASDDTTSSGTSGSDEENHDHEFLLGKTDTSPSEEFIKWAFELETGKGGVYEDDNVYYAVVRRDIKEREDWLLENHSNILHLMKDDDYEAMLNETAKDYVLDLNNDALNKYKPENLKK